MTVSRTARTGSSSAMACVFGSDIPPNSLGYDPFPSQDVNPHPYFGSPVRRFSDNTPVLARNQPIRAGDLGHLPRPVNPHARENPDKKDIPKVYRAAGGTRFSSGSGRAGRTHLARGTTLRACCEC